MTDVLRASVLISNFCPKARGLGLRAVAKPFIPSAHLIATSAEHWGGGGFFHLPHHP